MPPTRENHSLKARRSTGGTRKKGKLQRQRGREPGGDANTNAEIIIPKSIQEKELARREELRQELRAQSDNWDSKKKKRLEKYIDKKLKKEERLQIFEKLAKSQNEVASALLHSSSTLGTGRPLTHQEQMDKDENLQIRHAQDRVGKRRRKRKRRPGILDASDVRHPESEDEELNSLSPAPEGGFAKPLVDETEPSAIYSDLPPTGPTTAPSAPVAVGSALRRDSDGTAMTPVFRERRKAGFGKRRSLYLQKSHKDSASDTSFDSSDSAYDSSSVENPSDEEEQCSEGAEDEDAGEEENESVAGEADGEDANLKDGGFGANSSSVEEQEKSKKPTFKQWAVQQLALAKGYIADPAAVKDEQVISLEESRPTKRKKTNDADRMRGPLGQNLSLPTTAFAHHILNQGNLEASGGPYTKNINIKRPPDVAEARLMLPIIAEEQPIMEAIMLNPVVVICGETGSGKTTQVPQFLYEAGFGHPGSENPGMIGITQPRRVAAVSMANRVAHELSLTSSQVSYQIRYDATVSPSTSIKFMTDGVLLRELATDFILSRYSVIIVDEAHERSINTDILIGVLSRVVKLREDMWKDGKEGKKPLRLIIMSATLRVSDFVENKALFSVPPPIFNIPARQHPVTVHFSRRTPSDYTAEAIKKASRIHTCLPPGGVLIFLTGQNEIAGVCRRLEEKHGRKAIQRRKALHNSRIISEQLKEEAQKAAINPAQADIEPEDIDFDVKDQAQPDIDLGVIDQENKDGLASDADEPLDHELGIAQATEVPMHIVPLYSLLPSEKQMEVFKPPPMDTRLVVVATNIAETSLTIPGIKYVIDCGRAKERKYDVTNGIQAFQVAWISKASAAQRAGRAGRTGPGHCYRLYSSALYEHHFQQFNMPEILRAPIEGVVLQMKNMHIDTVINFPFPTPPDRYALQQAEKVLTHLGALRKSNSVPPQSNPVGSQITDLGRTMALFPLSPRFSRMLSAGQQHRCLPYVIAMVSAMSVGDPFLHEEAIEPDEATEKSSENDDLSYLRNEAIKTKEIRRVRRKAFFQTQHKHASLGDHTSDALKILSVVGAYEYHGGGASFCNDHFVRYKAMEEIHKLRAQISSIVQMYFPEMDLHFVSRLPPPDETQIKVLKQLITAACIDQVAVRKDLLRNDQSSGGSQYSNSHGVAYRALGIVEDVFIHPSSVLSDRPPPEYIVFQEVVLTKRMFVKGLTVVNPAWLSSLGKQALCTYSKPFKRSDGTLMTIPRFGSEGWELPAVRAKGVLTS